MVSLRSLACITLLAVAFSATVATGRVTETRANVGDSQGRKLLVKQTGLNKAGGNINFAGQTISGGKAAQTGVNVASGAGQTNQFASNQDAHAAGKDAIAANAVDSSQKNKDTTGSGKPQTNQAAVNQNAQASGDHATAVNAADIDQTNEGSGKQTNQAAVNQNAQATGKDATAANYADIKQTNKGGSGQTNQASLNQNAEATGTGDVSASSAGSVTVGNGGH